MAHWQNKRVNCIKHAHTSALPCDRFSWRPCLSCSGCGAIPELSSLQLRDSLPRRISVTKKFRNRWEHGRNKRTAAGRISHLHSTTYGSPFQRAEESLFCEEGTAPGHGNDSRPLRAGGDVFDVGIVSARVYPSSSLYPNMRTDSLALLAFRLLHGGPRSGDES